MWNGTSAWLANAFGDERAVQGMPVCALLCVPPRARARRRPRPEWLPGVCGRCPACTVCVVCCMCWSVSRPGGCAQPPAPPPACVQGPGKPAHPVEGPSPFLQQQLPVSFSAFIRWRLRLRVPSLTAGVGLNRQALGTNLHACARWPSVPSDSVPGLGDVARLPCLSHRSFWQHGNVGPSRLAMHNVGLTDAPASQRGSAEAQWALRRRPISYLMKGTTRTQLPSVGPGHPELARTSGPRPALRGRRRWRRREAECAVYQTNDAAFIR
jgi:hypothetical protein